MKSIDNNQGVGENFFNYSRESAPHINAHFFDIIGHSVNPSSVSRMSLSEHGRRSSEQWSRNAEGRRRSEDHSRRGSLSLSRQGSEVSVGRDDSVLERTDDEEEEERTPRRSRRKSPAASPQRPTVFENIAQMFGRAAPTTESPPRSRRPSLSSRSSRTGVSRRGSSRRSDAGSDYALESGDEDERWGYSSGEEYESESDGANEHRASDGESVDFRMTPEDSYPPSPGMALHIMTGDPIFGDEARIDMGELDLLEPPPPGPPSRQTVFIADEDVHVRFVGYQTIPLRHFIWQVLCVLTFGILGLLGRWFPRLWLRWVAQEKAFKHMERGFLVIEVRLRSLCIVGTVCDDAQDCVQGYCYFSNTQDQIPIPYQHCFPRSDPTVPGSFPKHA